MALFFNFFGVRGGGQHQFKEQMESGIRVSNHPLLDRRPRAIIHCTIQKERLWSAGNHLRSLQSKVHIGSILIWFHMNPPLDYPLHTSQSTLNSFIHPLAQLSKQLMDDPMLVSIPIGEGLVHLSSDPLSGSIPSLDGNPIVLPCYMI